MRPTGDKLRVSAQRNIDLRNFYKSVNWEEFTSKVPYMLKKMPKKQFRATSDADNDSDDL